MPTNDCIEIRLGRGPLGLLDPSARRRAERRTVERCGVREPSSRRLRPLADPAGRSTAMTIRLPPPEHCRHCLTALKGIA